MRVQRLQNRCLGRGIAKKARVVGAGKERKQTQNRRNDSRRRAELRQDTIEGLEPHSCFP